MAGMFYSLQEAAERLGKTEAEIREIVQSGQLREFRDGSNLLFKVDEVEALAGQVPAGPAAATPPPPPAQPVSPPPPPQYEAPEEIPLELDIPEAPDFEQLSAAAEVPLDPSEPQVYEPAEPMFEAPEEFDAPQAEAPEAEMLELEIPETAAPEFEAPAAPQPPQMEAFEVAAGEFEMPAEPEPAEMDLSGLEISDEAGGEFDIPSELEPAEMDLSDLDISELDDEIAQGLPAGTSEMLLAPETGAPAAPSELTNADTAITGEGVSVLGETDQDYAITDDTLGETMGSIGLASTGTTPDAALEEIEGDVNLDSFGSGSGLLDLSLQADDTSLGGILDEIYTAEDETVEPADAGTVAEVAAEADQMAADEALLAPQPMAMAGMAMAFEAPPDKGSNILGAMLFVPLLFCAYMAVVAVGGLKGVTPSLLTATQGFVWYIVGGFSVITAGIGLYAIFMADKEASPAAKKPAKPKKEKKPKKPKKPKKEKKKK